MLAQPEDFMKASDVGQDGARQKLPLDLYNLHGLLLCATTFRTNHPEYGLCGEWLFEELV